MGNEPRARRYAIVSGKGGVGKTVITANLAAALADAGQRTLVLDADLGLANMDVILGIRVAGTLQEVLAGSLSVDKALVTTRWGFDLLPAGSGSLETTLLTPELAARLDSVLHGLESRYDTILFDAGAGIGDVVLYFARIADDVVLVVTPEPTSLTDAYATIKILALRFGRTRFRLIVNQADPNHPEKSGVAVTNHLQQVVTRFLSAGSSGPISLQLVGSLPSDPVVGRAISRQQLIVETEPGARIASLIPRLAESLGRPLVQSIGTACAIR